MILVKKGTRVRWLENGILEYDGEIPTVMGANPLEQSGMAQQQNAWMQQERMLQQQQANRLQPGDRIDTIVKRHEDSINTLAKEICAINNKYNDSQRVLKTEQPMFGLYGSFKAYVQKHGDILFTLLLILVADKWFFHGALKGTLQGLADKLIGKAHKELDKE